MHLSYVILALGASGIFAAPGSVPVAHLEHERQDLVDPDWVKKGPVNGGVKVDFRIGLTQRNLENGHDLLMEISDPDSPRYGKHYTSDEIAQIFAPSTETIDAVKQWLSDEGIARDRLSLTYSSQWITLEATYAELEHLLHTKFHYFEHSASGATDIACEKYHLPHHVKEHVDFVTPGVGLFPRSSRDLEPSEIGVRSSSTAQLSQARAKRFSEPIHVPRPKFRPMPAAKSCNEAITPDCIKLLYNITESYKSHPGNQLGIFENTDRFLQNDLDKFFERYAPQLKKGTTPIVDGVDGGKGAAKTLGQTFGEAILDFEVAFPILNAGDIVDYPVGDGNEPKGTFYIGLGLNYLLDAVDRSYCSYSAFGFSDKPTKGVDEPFPDKKPGGYNHTRQCGVYKKTNVISISYAVAESFLPMGYQRRQCHEWMKLVMQGVTIVTSSGDNGVAAATVSATSRECLGKGGKSDVFNPLYPGTCPYLLVVGATTLPKGAEAAKDEEVATSSFGSGGGFSNIYPIPKYQKTQVENYFAKYVPPYPFYRSTYNSSFNKNGGIYNRAGRGYPDVSAVGDKIAIVYGGVPQLSGGTSASTPLWGALITRINAARLAAGMPTVGFVQPILYRNPQVFHDITKGNNPGCGTHGFNASKGWDPVTGLGTPDYPKLLKLFLDAGTSTSVGKA